MKVSIEMVIDEAMSLMVAKVVQTLARGLTLIEEAPIAIEFVGPFTIALLGLAAQAFIPYWAIREDGTSLLDSMKAKGLLLGTTPPTDAMLLLCIPIEEALACMYHCVVRVSGTFS